MAVYELEIGKYEGASDVDRLRLPNDVPGRGGSPKILVEPFFDATIVVSEFLADCDGIARAEHEGRKVLAHPERALGGQLETIAPGSARNERRKSAPIDFGVVE